MYSLNVDLKLEILIHNQFHAIAKVLGGIPYLPNCILPKHINVFCTERVKGFPLINLSAEHLKSKLSLSLAV